MSKPEDVGEIPVRLRCELCGMITEVRKQLAQTAYAALTMLY